MPKHVSIHPESLSPQVKKIIWDYIKQNLPGLDERIKKAINGQTDVELETLSPETFHLIEQLLIQHLDYHGFNMDDDEMLKAFRDTFDSKIKVHSSVKWPDIVKAVALHLIETSQIDLSNIQKKKA